GGPGAGDRPSAEDRGGERRDGPWSLSGRGDHQGARLTPDASPRLRQPHPARPARDTLVVMTTWHWCDRAVSMTWCDNFRRGWCRSSGLFVATVSVPLPHPDGET